MNELSYQRWQEQIEVELADKARAEERMKIRADFAKVLADQGKNFEDIVRIFEAIRNAANVMMGTDTEREEAIDRMLSTTIAEAATNNTAQ